MSNGKVMITILFAGQIAKILLQKMSYFPNSYTCSKNKEKVELVLSNYATKSDLKNAAGFHTSKFAKEVEELDKDKLAKVRSG